MADVFNRLFGKFSFTDLDTKNIKRHPVIVRKSINRTFDLLKKYIDSKEGAENKVYDLDYNQLYYVEKGYEVTLLLLSDNDGKTIVSSHIACRVPGKSLKHLYKVMNEIKKVLNNE